MNCVSIIVLSLSLGQLHILHTMQEERVEQAKQAGSCFKIYFPGGLDEVLSSQQNHLLSYATCVQKLKADKDHPSRDSMDDIRLVETETTTEYVEPIEFKMECSHIKASGKIECWKRVPVFGAAAPVLYEYGYEKLDQKYFSVLKKLHELTQTKS